MFVGCDTLTDIYVSPDHPVFAVIDNVLFDKTTKSLICHPAGLSATQYSIPDGIITIADNAFSDCKSLTSVTIPDSVTSIGKGVFYDYENLTLTVGRDSYAKQYAVDRNIHYVYSDANDWLNS